MGSVTLDNCKLFRDIAHHHSVSRGATLNGISQSAASQQITELEKQLGIALLDRSSRPLVLTAAGKLYQEFCRDLLRRKDEFDVTIARLKNETEGAVRVAAIYSVGLSEMNDLELEFARRMREARLEVEYLRPEKIYVAVLEDEVDLGLVSYPEPSREIHVIAWREEEMVLAVSPYHPLAARSAVEPGDLEGLEFVSFDDDLPIRRHVDEYLDEQGVRVNNTLHFDNLQMIKEAVAHRAGVSIMPARIMLEELSQGRLQAVPLTVPLYRPVGIIHRKKKHFNRATQAFLDLLQGKPTPEMHLTR